MSDLISKSALIEALGVTDDCSDCQYASGIYCVISVGSACQAIFDAPTIETEPRWIPVTERLPERVGRYLITDTSRGYEHVHESYYFPDGDEYDDEPYWEYNNVTAWMALPEPYREVEE